MWECASVGADWSEFEQIDECLCNVQVADIKQEMTELKDVVSSNMAHFGQMLQTLVDK